MADPRIFNSNVVVRGTLRVIGGFTGTSSVWVSPAISGTTTFTGTTSLAGTTSMTGTTALAGLVTVASGATLTTPTATITTAIVTATGTSATDAASVGSVFPVYVGVTGATGSGINLPTGPVGAVVHIGNDFAGVMRVYSNGGFINGTTGTTAFTMTATGNKLAFAVNTSASGAWYIKGNT